ncbi:hypothetical protein [Dysgonomonas sp. 520]|uniref:gliding motility lipoprotein GldD n=1 Tax=Dysgonomonas sp. 520 TaxID=2302931 RepID=UPI0013D6C50C|nr:hypothetical protein [Dysgonomonas sp. 520]NDW10347.1 hypothetical protein [Dysgonomonas sp. 520]
MKKYISIIIFFISITYSCSEYTPKPIGYNRIEKSQYGYKNYKTSDFSLLFPEISDIKEIKSDISVGHWFNIEYPNYHASIHCSYTPVKNKTDLKKLLEDSYRLVYSHSIVAEDISSSLYDDPLRKVSATIYNIEGNAATPLQFYATDSTKHFFRGSLYFNHKVNPDSIAPVVEYVREDIMKIIETISWTN